MTAVFDAVSWGTIVMVHASGKAVRASGHAGANGSADMDTVMLCRALIFGGAGITFAGLASSNHAADTFFVSNETVVDGFTKLAVVAVIYLVNIGAAWNTLKAKAGETLGALVLVGAGVVLNDTSIGCAAIDQTGFIFGAIGTVYAGQALT